MKKALNTDSDNLSANHQKLVDATIESISQRGLSETTIAHVSTLAGVSQGYAHFRFKSKENLLISSLQYLSNEYMDSWSRIFEEENLPALDRLIKIIENDFHSRIASRKKIAVWFSFYSEVKFIPAYQSICQDQDKVYFDQLKKVLEGVIGDNSYKDLDASEISETYLALVDGLWQKILFDRKNYSNEFCKGLVYKYFRSIFPNENILDIK
ncbi:MAG: TetR family transcriptional regulator C-terminal domain-containing protein [Candidatus Pelagibacterales bacterium]